MTLEGTIRHGMSLSTECVSDVMVIAFGPIGSYVDLSGYYTKKEIDDKGYLTEHQDISGKADSADLASVATTGSYNDLGNKPSIPAAQVQSDWSQSDSSKVDYIKNKPTIPAAQVQADWNASSGVAQILNKPTIPTVPTNVGAFTNDAGYLTQHQSLANYYTKTEINTMIGDIETLLASI